jgi:hypothetical protein
MAHMLSSARIAGCSTLGRRRLYRLNGPALKPIHDWVKKYERTWRARFEAMDVVLEELKQQEEQDGGNS